MTTYLGTTTDTYDAADRLTAASGPGATSYTYDPDGHELTAGAATYTYDLAGRLVSATVGATTETYTWSGDGIRRSAATGPGAATTDFLVDRLHPLPEIALERDGTGAVRRDALYGLARIALVDAAGGVAYEHTDALGSVTDRTSASGVSVGWAEDAPYGAVRSAGALAGVPADPFGFSGQYLDATSGLVHLRARQYDPTSGRFTAVDPLPPQVGQPCTSTYVYAKDDPIGRVDPTGAESRPPAQVTAGCNLGVTERAGRLLGGLLTTAGGVSAIVLGTAVGGSGLTEIAGAGTELAVTDGLAVPVAIIQVSGGISLITYGVAEGEVGVAAVALGFGIAGSAFCQ